MKITPPKGSLRIDAFGLSLSALVSAMLYAGAIAPMLRGHAGEAELITLLSEKEREAANAQAENRAKAEALSKLQWSSEQDALPLQPISRRIERIGEINKAAVDAGLTLDQIAPGKSMETVPFIAVPIKIVGKGAFAASTTFLGVLHESFPDVKVRSLRLVASPESPEKSVFEFDLVWHADRDGSVVTAPAP